jgi:ferredoxin/flavodoxin---NADP+ reductase
MRSCARFWRTAHPKRLDIVSLHIVISVRQIAEGTCLIRFTREGLCYQPGQYLLLGVPGGDLREYSIFSRPHDAFLEVLVRVIPEGAVSSRLSRLLAGDALHVHSVKGSFLIPLRHTAKRFLFVATGTGIAPFHSITGSMTDLAYEVYHGVRYASECYARETFPADRYHACLSREMAKTGEYQGRVTQVLFDVPVAPDTECYLCGSCDMIYDMFAILQAKGIPRAQIHTETYY